MQIGDLIDGKLLKPAFKAMFKELSELDQLEINLSYGTTLSEKLYCHFHGIKVAPACQCGNPVKFVSFGEGYRDYCSRDCKKKYSKPDTSKREYAAIQEKIKATNLARYGVENAFALAKHVGRSPEAEARKVEKWKAKRDEILAKKRATNLVRYGNTCSVHGPGPKAKAQATCVAKYGVETPFVSEDVKRRCETTKKARYGNPKFTNRQKAKATYLDKFGGPSPFSSRAVHEKSITSCQARYGVDYGMQSAAIRKRAFSSRGPSGPEKKFAEMLTNRGFIYEQEYPINGKCFDFAVKNADGTVNTLVEVDGEYFHGLLSDYDGRHVRGETDASRFQKVPDGVKFLAFDAKNVERAFSDLCANFGVDYETWITRMVEKCSSEPFPYPEYDDDRMTKDWESLRNSTSAAQFSHLGQSVIRQFHRSMWTAHRDGYPSPVEAWRDKALLERCIRNRFIYSSGLSSQKIADGFTVARIAPRVSVFRASLAKTLIEKYLNEFGEVFDPFSGFSGRMLGACSLGKRYVGQDMASEHVRESNEIIGFLGLDATVAEADILSSNGEHECLFTCPPYTGKESWGGESRPRRAEDWVDECLARFKCGRYVFVVDDPGKHSAHVVETISNKSHFSSAQEYVLVFD